jgi:hypothetical protein
MGDKMTYEQAVKACKDMWETIDNLGTNKNSFTFTPIGRSLTDGWKDRCALCEYVVHQDEGRRRYCAKHCPLRFTPAWKEYEGRGEFPCTYMGYDSNISGTAFSDWMRTVRAIPDTEPKKEPVYQWVNVTDNVRFERRVIAGRLGVQALVDVRYKSQIIAILGANGWEPLSFPDPDIRITNAGQTAQGINWFKVEEKQEVK